MKSLDHVSLTGGQADPKMRELRRESVCPLCGQIGQGRRRFQKTTWNYEQCIGCGALSLNPIPDEIALESYYNREYVVPIDRYARQTTKHAPFILKKLTERVPGKGKLLEIGCSSGSFLDAARREGWDVAGVELDERAATHGREERGLKIFMGTLESEVGHLEPPYDVIASFHVIEHLRDPIGFLRRCRGLLRDEGLLILKTPNLDSWIARRTGVFWEWLCPPAHIHIFSPAALEVALRKSGFHVRETSTRRGDASNNLFQLLRATAAYAGSKRGAETGKKKTSRANGLEGRLDKWQIVMAATEAVYYPFGLVLDPFMEKNGLQPELVAIATRSDLH